MTPEILGNHFMATYIRRTIMVDHSETYVVTVRYMYLKMTKNLSQISIVVIINMYEKDSSKITSR